MRNSYRNELKKLHASCRTAFLTEGLGAFLGDILIITHDAEKMFTASFSSSWEERFYTEPLAMDLKINVKVQA
jgi:hypothetical protein